MFKVVKYLGTGERTFDVIQSFNNEIEAKIFLLDLFSDGTGNFYGIEYSNMFI